MKRLLTLITLLCSVAVYSQMTAHMTPASAGYGTYHAGYKVPFLLHTPPDAEASIANSDGKKYPIIIFFHGIGERTVNYPTMAGMGTGDLSRLYATTPASLLRYSYSPLVGKRYAAPGRTDSTQFFYAFPQTWQGADYTWIVYPHEMIRWIKANLSHIADTNRIYIAGLSFGAGTVWCAIQDSLLNIQIAAAAPACPGYNRYGGFRPTGTPVLYQEHNWPFLARSGMPIYAIHAVNDGSTPNCNGVGSCITDRSIDSLMKHRPLMPPIYRRYTTGGHSIWDRMWSPALASTEYPNFNGNTTTFDIPIQSWFLQFSTDGPRRPDLAWQYPKRYEAPVVMLDKYFFNSLKSAA